MSEKSGAILGCFGGKILDGSIDDRPRATTVAGNSGQGIEDARIQADLLRLGEVQLSREGLDHHAIVVEKPEAVSGGDHAGGVEPDDAKLHVREVRERKQPV